jgi:tetratricopeptide (TPR) repeat protein
VPHYLRLALWPSRLVFDYGPLSGPGRWYLPTAVLLVLLAGTLAGLRRRDLGSRTAGFLGAWFFALLAPTALVPVATQTIAEHRMYLPLAAVMTALVLAVGQAVARPAVLAVAAGLVALGLGTATAARNEVYGSELALWRDTVAKRPGNDRAHNNLGNAFFHAGRMPEAREQYEQALRLHPGDNAEVQYNLGAVLAQEGHWTEAIAPAAEAVRLAPENPDARASLGTALANSGRVGEALAQFQAAARLNPGSAAIHNDLGSAWFLLGRRGEAVAEYREALRIDPAYADARVALDHLTGAPP